MMVYLVIMASIGAVCIIGILAMMIHEYRAMKKLDGNFVIRRRKL